MDKIRDLFSHCKAYCNAHRRISWTGGIFAIFVLASLGYAWHFSISPITPPEPSFFSAESIKKGELVANAGFCAACHTRQDGGVKGAPFAGDFKIETPFGDFYSPNITPDPKHGIGRWSKPAFVRAMRSGIARNGQQLFPTFPFDRYTYLTDEDLSDLYAYLMTRPAVDTKPRANSIYFPFNIRLLQAGWKLLFLHKGSISDDPSHSPEWNRGHYLAEGPSHCSSCHTPRNIAGAEKLNLSYDGAYIDGWFAPPLNSTNPSPMPWTKDDLFSYLTKGYAPKHDVSAGPMAHVVHQFYANLPESDRMAVAEYFADKMRKTGKDADNSAEIAKIDAVLKDTSHPDAPKPLDQALFDNTCASCHKNVGTTPILGRPELAYTTSLWLDDPTNFLQLMFRGIGAHEGIEGLVMPSFYTAMSDDEVARVVAYLRRTRTTKPAWKNLTETVRKVRASISPAPINSLK